MITIERLSPQLAPQLKQVRLTALKDTPGAFGSTYAQESLRTDEEWMSLALLWNSAQSAFYLALEDGAPRGMVGGKLDEVAPHQAWVVSMWVAPAQRRTSLGTRLMEKVQQWARAAGVHDLRLMVTSNNGAATAL